MRQVYRFCCILLGVMFLSPAAVVAQDPFEELVNKAMKDYDKAVNTALGDYQAICDKAEEDYARAMREAWSISSSVKGVEPPKMSPVPPVKYVKEEEKELPKNLQLVKEDIISLKRLETVEPVYPEFIPKDAEKEAVSIFSFSFYGNYIGIEMGDEHRFTLRSLDEQDIADAWTRFSHNDYKRLVATCLFQREEYELCDWAYLEMLNYAFEYLFEGHCNESTLLTAYVFAQSGYRIRLGKSNNKLYMLYACDCTVFSKNFWVVDGENYYLYNDENVNSLSICKARYDNEHPLSLQIERLPFRIGNDNSAKREFKSGNNFSVTASTYVNKDLIQFFDKYPSGGSDNEKWSICANVPLSDGAKAAMYPSLRKSIAGKSEIDALNTLLNFVQTAFVYEYDDKVWGCDRVFFAEETLFYPYADCEDRSILFARLVRDLMGLDVVFLYYPGHLATAVKCKQLQKGDYITVQSERYLVCDPTYINAPAGKSIPQTAGKSVTVIMLN